MARWGRRRLRLEDGKKISRTSEEGDEGELNALKWRGPNNQQTPHEHERDREHKSGEWGTGGEWETGGNGGEGAVGGRRTTLDLESRY